MVLKLLVLALIIVAVLVGFRMISGTRGQKRPEKPPEIETQKCAVCGNYTVTDAGPCDNSECPYK